MLNTLNTAGSVIGLGEDAVARLLSDGRWEVTQGEVGSYRYRRVFDRATLEAGYAAWKSGTTQGAPGAIQISADTWADCHETHIDFEGEEIEMVEGFGSRIGMLVEDVQRLLSVTTH
ncbi:MAG: hypothetical protein ACLGIM_17740 [Alphaproteobacteria bacterium]|jgi:hypothetical protein